MRLIMLGAPGAGKGTQAKMIAEAHKIPHISTGDIFRANIKEGTALGVQAKSYMDKGELVPDSLVCELVADRIAQDDCREGFVLDGFPRTIPQAEALDAALAQLGIAIDAAVDIEVSDESIVERMGGRRACTSCGATYHLQYAPPKTEGVCDRCGEKLIMRDDDAPETVKHRLAVYHAQTSPLIDFYEAKRLLKRIDGMLPMQEVFAVIEREIRA